MTSCWVNGCGRDPVFAGGHQQTTVNTGGIVVRRSQRNSESRIHLFGASELRMSVLGIWKQEKRVLELVDIRFISWSSFLEKALTSKKRVKHELLWTFSHLFYWLIEPKAELKSLLALIIVIIIILISLNNPPINQVSLERLSNESFPRSHNLEMEELEHPPIWSQSRSP